MKRRSVLSGFRSEMIGTYVSMTDMYTISDSGAGAGFSAVHPPAAARAVTDIRGGAISAVVSGTVRIFFVGSLPVVSLLK